MGFVPATSAQLAAFPYPTLQGTMEFDCTPVACSNFGYQHGQRLKASKGAQAGQECFVIGVSSGVLWVHWDSDKYATPCTHSYSQEEIDAKYGIVCLGAAPDVVDAGPAPATSRPGSFEYPGPFGQMHEFDITDEALAPFGVKHGEVLRVTKGISDGKDAVVIGIENGDIWIHVDGDRSAELCRHCTNESELRARYGFVPHPSLGRVRLEPRTPYWKPAGRDPLITREISGTLNPRDTAARRTGAIPTVAESTPLPAVPASRTVGAATSSAPAIQSGTGRGGYSGSAASATDADEILAVELSDEPLGEQEGPLMYRFLRAHARFRLGQSAAPAGQALMHFYVTDTAARTGEALENLAMVRRYIQWRRTGNDPAWTRRGFTDLSERDMFDVLLQLPARCVSIQSKVSSEEAAAGRADRAG